MTTTTRTFTPADPAGEIRHAADRLAALPPTPLTSAVAGLLTVVAGDMYGGEAHETRDWAPAAGLQVCGPAGPQPTWTAALALARAVTGAAAGPSDQALAAVTADAAVVTAAAVAASDPALWHTALQHVHALLDPAGETPTAAAGGPGEGPRLVITRGLPGSGKSTQALAWVAKDPRRRARLNRDDLRDMLHGGRFGTPAQEVLVTAIQHQAAETMLGQGTDVVADDTNLSPEAVGAWRRLAERAGARMTVWDFTDADVDECVRRDAARDPGQQVGETVIRRLHQQHLAGGDLA
jgi:predicted kinase